MKPYKLSDGKKPVISTVFDIFKKFVFCVSIKLLAVKVANSRFKRTNSLKQAFLHSSADCHNLARCFHLSIKSVISICKLIKRETCNFSYNIVESRLKRCWSVSNRNFVKVHTYADFSRNPCDRIARSFRSKSRRT